MPDVDTVVEDKKVDAKPDAKPDANPDGDAKPKDGTITGGDDKPKEGDKPDEGKPQESGADVPDEYKFKLPDGVELDAEMLERATTLFKENKFGAETAQQLVDLQLESMATQEKRIVEAQAKQASEWAQTVRDDGELGGANYDKTVAAVRGVMSRFGSPALRELMNATGLGNNPDIVRFFTSIATAPAEGDSSGGKSKTGGGSSEDKVLRDMYPSMFPGD